METLPAGDYVNFAFYRMRREWKKLDVREKEVCIQDFQGALERFSEQIWLRSYATTGFRGDVDFLLWSVTRELPLIQDLAVAVAKSDLSYYMELPYSYLAMTRESMYVKGHKNPLPQGGEEGARWLFIYPFVKTRDWYKLPFETRQRMMREHFQVGHQFPGVKINTTYSFGLDDQEFVLAFEADSPKEFQDLVMKLRESEASSYTLRDVPIFTCLRKPLEDILRALS